MVAESSLAAQWLRLSAVTAVARVQPLLGEPRTHKPQGLAKKRESEYGWRSPEGEGGDGSRVRSGDVFYLAGRLELFGHNQTETYFAHI